ncbi:MAG: hypothetical protein O3B84_03910 [Chloroflexi bacterium]|nr:hypothetical protein [Chloroflexota bacterium]
MTNVSRTDPTPSATTQTRRRRRQARLVLAGMFVLSALLLAAVSGFAGTFPIGRGTVVDQAGNTIPVLVLNPTTEAQPVCGCAGGGLKVVIPLFALVRESSGLGTPVVVTIDRGDIICVLDQNQHLWWEVSLSGTCEGTGWVSNDAFPTIVLALMEEPSADQDQTDSDATGDFVGGIPPVNLGGGVQGMGGLTVSQSLRLLAVNVVGAQGLGIVNEVGSRFTVAIETQIGSTFEVSLTLKNASNNPLIGELRLPPALVVSVIGGDGVTGNARFAEDGWKFTMAADHANAIPGITVRMRVPSGTLPGFSGL